MDDVALEPCAGGTTVRMSRLCAEFYPIWRIESPAAAEKLDPCCMSGTT
jgi:hypothetical protein